MGCSTSSINQRKLENTRRQAAGVSSQVIEPVRAPLKLNKLNNSDKNSQFEKKPQVLGDRTPDKKVNAMGVKLYLTSDDTPSLISQSREDEKSSYSRAQRILKLTKEEKNVNKNDQSRQSLEKEPVKKKAIPAHSTKTQFLDKNTNKTRTVSEVTLKRLPELEQNKKVRRITEFRKAQQKNRKNKSMGGYFSRKGSRGSFSNQKSVDRIVFRPRKGYGRVEQAKTLQIFPKNSPELETPKKSSTAQIKIQNTGNPVCRKKFNYSRSLSNSKPKQQQSFLMQSPQSMIKNKFNLENISESKSKKHWAQSKSKEESLNLTKLIQSVPQNYDGIRTKPILKRGQTYEHSNILNRSNHHSKTVQETFTLKINGITHCKKEVNFSNRLAMTGGTIQKRKSFSGKKYEKQNSSVLNIQNEDKFHNISKISKNDSIKTFHLKSNLSKVISNSDQKSDVSTPADVKKSSISKKNDSKQSSKSEIENLKYYISNGFQKRQKVKQNRKSKRNSKGASNIDPTMTNYSSSKYDLTIDSHYNKRELNKSLVHLDEDRVKLKPEVRLVKNKRFSLYGHREQGHPRVKKSPTLVTNAQSITTSAFSIIKKADASFSQFPSVVSSNQYLNQIGANLNSPDQGKEIIGEGNTALRFKSNEESIGIPRNMTPISLQNSTNLYRQSEASEDIPKTTNSREEDDTDLEIEKQIAMNRTKSTSYFDKLSMVSESKSKSHTRPSEKNYLVDNKKVNLYLNNQGNNELKSPGLAHKRTAKQQAHDLFKIVGKAFSRKNTSAPYANILGALNSKAKKNNKQNYLIPIPIKNMVKTPPIKEDLDQQNSNFLHLQSKPTRSQKKSKSEVKPLMAQRLKNNASPSSPDYHYKKQFLDNFPIKRSQAVRKTDILANRKGVNEEANSQKESPPSPLSVKAK